VTRSGVSLTRETIGEVADAVAERLRADPPSDGGSPVRWVTATQLARLIGRSPQWVREHAALLGAKRLGEGPRAPYLFNVPEAFDRLPSCQSNRESPRSDSPAKRSDQANRQRGAMGTTTDLLPIRGVHE
jgi:hypothetical protein